VLRDGQYDLLTTLTAAGAEFQKTSEDAYILCLYRKGFVVVSDWRVGIEYEPNDYEIATVSEDGWKISLTSSKNKILKIRSYQFVWGLDGL